MAMDVSFNPVVKYARALLIDPSHFWHLAALVILGDAVLSQLIIRFIPYTEIDWETYMVHTKLIINGERDYAKITGPTGPLVYPAGHVQIHRHLFDVTSEGKNLALAQQIYGALYILSLTLSCAIYKKARGVPNWIILLLPLSKRLHSIFMLRLFNDCWALIAVQAAILALQNGMDDTGTLLFSAALSVKMSILLYLPGLLVILFKRRGLASTVRYMMTIVATQAIFAWSFLEQHPKSYLKYAFDLSRIFMYKWTVNWRFFDEDTFLNTRLAKTLLLCHLSTLMTFGLFRWCQKDGGIRAVLDRGLRRPLSPAAFAPVTPDYVATVLFTSNLIGVLFARSLHYQFYSWYAQQLPFLAWRTRYPVALKLALLLGIEYAWNVFPSSRLSSAILLSGNVLLVVGVFFGHYDGRAFSAAK